MSNAHNRGQVLGLWYTNKHILNPNLPSTLSSNDGIPCSASDLVKKIKISMQRMMSSGISDDGMHVDYAMIKASEGYIMYKELVSMLHDFDIISLSTAEKKSLFINVYNCLTIHAMIEGLLHSFPGGVLSRLHLYASASYLINRIPFSLNEIENGILRSNQKSPSPWSKIPFPEDNDSKTACCIDTCDPRIHFALNCGAASCPPISVYSSIEDELESQLHDASISFIEQSCRLDVDKKTLNVSMIFNWYRHDFGDSDEMIIRWIKTHSDKLFDNINLQPSEMKLVFDPYNWTLNT